MKEVLAIDRVTGRPGRPVPGWTGRWMREDSYVLDSENVGVSRHSRDESESDDLEALLTLAAHLKVAVGSGSWLELEACPLLAGHDDESLRLQPRELVLEEHVASLARICVRFLTRLGERSELLPVARVRRPARRALERLSAHTEDWAVRSLSGPIPRRALAVTREEEADLYENRMVVELVHPILSSELRARLRKLRRLQSDLADLERARNEGTHQRLERLYRFWGQDAARAAESSSTTATTLLRLEALTRQVEQLRASPLGKRLKGKRTGQRSLRKTNVIENDRHYRAAGLVWSAYELEPVVQETDEARVLRYQERQRTFASYVLGLVVRALSDLSYSPQVDHLPSSGTKVELQGRWGTVTVEVGFDEAILLEAEGRRTRFVPLLDLVLPDDDPAATAERWGSLVAEVERTTIVAFLAASDPIARLTPELARQMISGGQDQPQGSALLSGIPVSPLETTSLERIARAVALAVLEPALKSYPPVLHLDGRPVPRRLLDRLTEAGIVQDGASPLFHRENPDRLCLRRPLLAREQIRLDALVRHLSDQAKSPGWQRDLASEIDGLSGAVGAAAEAGARLLACPLCSLRADPLQVTREGDLFMITCRSCSTRWGHERCGACAQRVPVIAPASGFAQPATPGPGWVERIFGQDCLSSPCWSPGRMGRYVCPSCGTCPVVGTGEDGACSRCSP